MMICKLIWKDIKVTGRRGFLGMMPGGMLAGALFIFRYYHWNVYFVYGFILAAAIPVVHAVTEKNGLNEGFTASLPVSRFDIVSARYLSTALSFLLCLALWCLNGKAASLAFPDQANAFTLAFTAKGGFIAFVFATAMTSLFLPASFAFGKTGLILASLAAGAAAISTIPLLFHPKEFSYVHFFLPSDLPMVAITGSAALLALLASFLLSVRVYRTKSL
jgi:hypothetical protein